MIIVEREISAKRAGRGESKKGQVGGGFRNQYIRKGSGLKEVQARKLSQGR
jgi:hypothetical protein